MPIPVPKVPHYEIVLPVSKMTVKFRPFLVKEEKILLMANEDADGSKEIMDAIKQVLTACTMEKVAIDKLPVADVEYLFIKIRSKSISESIDSTVHCDQCNTDIEYPINLEKVEMFNQVKDQNVDLGDGIIVTMNFPTVSTSLGLDEFKAVDIPLVIVSNMIKAVTIEEQMYDATDFTRRDIMDWLDNLSKKQLDKLNDFLADLPKIIYSDKIKCTCGNEIKIYMEGLESFFG